MAQHSVRWLLVGAVSMTALSACGPNQVAVNAVPPAQATPAVFVPTPAPTFTAASGAPAPAAPTAAAPRATAPPTPTPLPAGPYIEYQDATANDFATETGKVTARFVDTLITTQSPMANGVLATHNKPDYTDVDALDYVTASGDITRVETLKANTYRSAIGNPRALQWAWIINGDQSGCMGTPSNAGSDVYISSTIGTGKKLAHLPPAPGHAQWTFYQWTESGIVLRQGTPPGCGMGPRTQPWATFLLDPATGAVTSLASTLGKNCPLQARADTGAMVCALYSERNDDALAASETVVRYVSPSGVHTDYTLGQLGFTHTCPGKEGDLGDITMAPDGRYFDLVAFCYDSGPDGAIVASQEIIYNVAAQKGVLVQAPTGTYQGTDSHGKSFSVKAPQALDIDGFLSDDRLVAGGYYAAPSGSYIVNPDGSIYATLPGVDVDGASVTPY